MSTSRRYDWGVRPPSPWLNRCEELAFVVGIALAIVLTVLVLSPFVGGGR